MFSFEGNFKKERNINLGGKRQQIDKQELLRKAQLERQQRERERKRIQSATTIQAFWRGRACARRVRQEQRAAWDAAFGAIHDQIAVLDPPRVGKVVLQLWHHLSLFYSPTYDLSRLDGFCRFLLLTYNEAPLVFAPYSTSQESSWSYALKSLFVLCLNSIILTGPTDDISSPLRLLKVTTEISQWSTVTSNKGPDGAKAALQKLLALLVDHGFYGYIRSILMQYAPEQKESPIVATMIELAMRPLSLLRNTPTLRIAVPHLISEILTIELLPNRISIDSLGAVSRYLPFDDVIRMLADDDTVLVSCDKQPSDPYCALLANILAFGHQRVDKMSLDSVSAYISALQRVLQLVPAPYLRELDEHSIPDAGDESADEIDEPMNGVESDQKPLDPRIRRWLMVLVNAGHLGIICKSMWTHSEAPRNFMLMHTRRVANLIMSLFIRWPGRKTSVSNILLFRSDESILSKLYAVIRQSSLFVALSGGASAMATFRDASIRDDWLVIVLLTELLSRVLLTMGDDEFFGKDPPLPLSGIVELSSILKSLTFSLYWDDTNGFGNLLPGSQLTPAYLTQLFTRLLQQVHRRDSRRQFCPEGHWLMPMAFDTTMFAQLFQDSEDESISKSLTAKHRPYQAVLKNLPFVIPFETRVGILRDWIRQDRARAGLDEDQWHSPIARVTIRRPYVFEDGYTHLNELGPRLKKRIQITFVSDQGLAEAGIDGGGVFKEFLTALTRQAFDTNYGLFQATADQLLYPSSHSYAQQETQLLHLQFLGRILGKAIYEGVLVDAAFAGFFLAKWLGQKSYIDDLPSLDPELYKGLMFLKSYPGDVEKDLGLTFSIDAEEFGQAKSINLIPNGANVPVTNENRIQYIYLVAHYKLNVQIQRQCAAFFFGLSDLISPAWLQMFNQQELQILLGGVSTPIDVEDLKKHTVLAGYEPTDKTIQLFWNVVSEFSDEDRRSLVKFVTSCSRPPLLGFAELNPPFCLRFAGGEVERLPTSSTCVNLLKLPAYQNKNQLREKLLYAIKSGAGFELS
ncbi:hypothetical protein BC832DRAFT_593809 [Gaertneriomyces semiglobifer]|nr:hypothetical protein BC832DRAFT_593809 [Gaertneriomyces semiglobifer]